MKWNRFVSLVGFVVLMVGAAMLQQGCEEDDTESTDEDGDSTTDGDEETVPDPCEEHDEQACLEDDTCWAYYAWQIALSSEDGCLIDEFYESPDGLTFALCQSKVHNPEMGCESIEMFVISPDDVFWHFSDACIPHGWVSADRVEDFWGWDYPFCIDESDGDTEEEATE